MHYNELEGHEKLATKDWVEHELANFKRDLNLTESERRLARSRELINWAGTIAFGFSWGFLIAMFIFLRH
jgi:hypothetical protein